MKKTGIWALAVCAGLLAGQAIAAGGAKDLDAAFAKAMLAGDAAAVAGFYADDAVLVMPGSTALKGKKAILDAITGFLAANTVKDFKLSDTHHRTSGKLSAGWGRYTMVIVPKAGGAATTDAGTYSDVAELQGGKWLYVSDHTASDPPPAPPAKK
ncbi:MAG TPA: nuclear transport factor 2 family protein [Thermoanaerobaculia bacterium]|nr:nuclear transport factor 2 family protein [Thermoanaerobaculia bacterium]